MFLDFLLFFCTHLFIIISSVVGGCTIQLIVCAMMLLLMLPLVYRDKNRGKHVIKYDLIVHRVRIVRDLREWHIYVMLCYITLRLRWFRFLYRKRFIFFCLFFLPINFVCLRLYCIGWLSSLCACRRIFFFFIFCKTSLSHIW